MCRLSKDGSPWPSIARTASSLSARSLRSSWPALGYLSPQQFENRNSSRWSSLPPDRCPPHGAHSRSGISFVRRLTAKIPLFADDPHSWRCSSRLPTRIGILMEELLHLKRTSPQSCSVHGAFKDKVWPFVAERIIALKEFRWGRTMLTSPRTVPEISCSSILAEQGSRIAFPILSPERSVEPLTLHQIEGPLDELRKTRGSARMAGPA